MKFYNPFKQLTLFNPFKPHIVQLDEAYAVRRLCFTMFLFWPSWEYRDRKDDYWWNIDSHVRKYCFNRDLIEARDVLQKLKPVYLPKAKYLES